MVHDLIAQMYINQKTTSIPFLNTRLHTVKVYHFLFIHIYHVSMIEIEESKESLFKFQRHGKAFTKVIAVKVHW